MSDANDLQEVAQRLDEHFNDGRQGEDRTIGFCLIVFGFGAPGIGNYVSNAERADMITALRETADRLEKRQDKVRYPTEED